MASHTLSNSILEATFSNGRLYSLQAKGHALEYMGNPENTSYPTIQKMNQWMGDWRFRIWRGDHFEEELTSKSSVSQTCSSDGKTICMNYDNDSAVTGGLQSLALSQHFHLESNALVWNATITNRTEGILEVGEASIAFLTNTDFAGIFRNPTLSDQPKWHGEKQRLFHEERVFQHLCINGKSAYALLQRPKGDWPALLFQPSEDTFIEAAYQMDKYLGNQFSVIFEAPYYLSCFANGAMRAEEWNALTEATRPCPCGNHSLMLTPGESHHFAFRFSIIESVQEMQNELVANDRIAVKAYPGMAAPIGQPILFSIRSHSPISIQPNGNMHVELLRQEGDRSDYRLTADQPGQKQVIVHHNGGTSHLFFLFTEEPRRLLKQRASFIEQFQLYDNPQDPWNRHHVFMPYDDMLGTLFLDSLETWQVSGTDELCLPTAMFLAEKNCTFPNQQEIRTLETFIEDGLFGKLQNRDTYLTLRSLCWVPDEEIYPSDRFYGGKGSKAWAQSTNRCFQYALISDLYYSMYRIAKRGGTCIRGWEAYLEMTYRTALNWFDNSIGDNKWNGGPSGGTIVDILDTLKEERPEWFSILDERVRTAAGLNNQAVYPYGSELYIDQTAHNQLHAMLDYYGFSKKASEVCQMTKALRAGYQPSWYQFGNDKRGNVCCWYGTPMNSRALYEKFDAEGDVEALQLAYGGLSSFLSTVRRDGAAHGWFLCWPDRMGFDRRSLDTDMGLYNYLRHARTYVVENPFFGWVGYGCSFEQKDGVIRINILDGIGRHITIAPMQLKIICKPGGMEYIVLDAAHKQCFVHFTDDSVATMQDLSIHAENDWTIELQ